MSHFCKIVALLAIAGSCCIQQGGTDLRGISALKLWRVCQLSDTLPTATGPAIFAGLGSWAYQWTNVVGLGAGCYSSLHLLKCQVGWLSSLLVLPVAQQWHLSYYSLGAFMVQLTIEFEICQHRRM